MTDPSGLHVGDCLPWLRSLPDGCCKLVVADPPYGIRKASWDRFDSDDAYLAWCREWLAEVARILAPDGSAYVMGFSEILADVKAEARGLFPRVRWLVWHYRNKANLGSDWGRSHESIVHFRRKGYGKLNVDAVREPYNAHTTKYPERSQGDSSTFTRSGKKPSWTPHPLGAKPRDVFVIPILNNGMAEKTPHPTQKPIELIRRLVEGSSDPGDLVIDPFAGSGTTLVVAELTGRRWAGCEQSDEYAGFVADRLAAVQRGEISLEAIARREAAMRANRGKVRG
jgi:site-specific DNA-methyltransferase (adenine-specific)